MKLRVRQLRRLIREALSPDRLRAGALGVWTHAWEAGLEAERLAKEHQMATATTADIRPPSVSEPSSISSLGGAIPGEEFAPLWDEPREEPDVELDPNLLPNLKLLKDVLGDSFTTALKRAKSPVVLIQRLRMGVVYVKRDLDREEIDAGKNRPSQSQNYRPGWSFDQHLEKIKEIESAVWAHKASD